MIIINVKLGALLRTRRKQGKSFWAEWSSFVWGCQPQ